jgi:hypothetical protein
MRDYEDNLEEFWDTCDKRFSHTDDVWLNRSQTAKAWAIKFARKYGLMPDVIPEMFAGKVVADYGSGCGELGHQLNKLAIQLYIGIDISQRQLDDADRYLSADGGDYELLKTPVDFGFLGADIFHSQACLQHFPSQGYTESFLVNLNTSGIPLVFLQYRNGERVEWNQLSPTYACRLTPEWIEERMNCYSLEHVSPVVPKTGYQFCRLGVHLDGVNV